jgi:3-phenylpropionate/trans-cinnamate dioxygenase ferredoxin reductase subunit
VTSDGHPPADRDPDVLPTFVVVGGGHAGASAVRVLAESGHQGRIVLVSAEDRLPYDRTTLSKVALLSGADESPPRLWQPDEHWASSIEVHLDTEVTGIDLGSKKLSTTAGEVLPFDRVLLATGAEPRRLALDGADGSGVHYLRDARDADAIRRALAQPSRLVVIGGGVIGLEIAATARVMGHEVAVVEAGPRLLGRSVPAEVAAHLAALHASDGVGVHVGVLTEQIVRERGHVTAVRLANGVLLPADLVVIGVGIRPRDELAASAGLAVDDGILVDGSGRTSHPDVFAAGDAVRSRRQPEERGVRLESWQPAGRFGEIAAHSMLGAAATYSDYPWTWSDQYDVTLQSVGIPPDEAESIVCTSQDRDSVLVLSLVDGKIVAACGVAPGAGIAKPIRAVQIHLERTAPIDVDAIRASTGDLKSLTRLLMSSVRAIP